jgi:hypothetical protein
MSDASTIILVPFMIAFVMFVVRFYGKEGARSKLQLSFLLAVGSVVIVVLYLALAVMKMLPEYGAAGFGIAGVAMMLLSIYRMFFVI